MGPFRPIKLISHHLLCGRRSSIYLINKLCRFLIHRRKAAVWTVNPSPHQNNDNPHPVKIMDIGCGCNIMTFSCMNWGGQTF